MVLKDGYCKPSDANSEDTIWEDCDGCIVGDVPREYGLMIIFLMAM